MPVKQEINDYLSNKWAIDMLHAPVQAPVLCIKGCIFPCCFAYQQRKEILAVTGEPYLCCGGTCPCGPCGKPCPEDQVPMWLGLEACCCPFQAVTANRYMLQTRFERMNDPCDDMLLAYAAMLACVALFAECFMDKEEADAIKALSDVVNCTVCACMLAQQQTELDVIREEVSSSGYKGPSATVMRVLPPEQVSMISSSTQVAPKQYGSMGP
eukprot:TRINITY_DN65337_c0_g2_i1.p1 TRINITY_DN65337_c0_g2~~TRINITY_DN65337_c0_g2_i1.p1  ORF type:complete len:212 (+),score=43.95 TRINITY_DN65337_c0_g2_i1:127-762(+)